MCGPSGIADRLLMLHEARVAADELVERCLGLQLAKAMNLGTPAGFDRAVALLAARLRRATSRTAPTRAYNAPVITSSTALSVARNPCKVRSQGSRNR